MSNGKAQHSPRAARPRDDERISTIHAGEGARVTTRKNAAEAADRARHNAEKRYFRRHPEALPNKNAPKRSTGKVVLLVVAGILVLAIVFCLGTCITAALTPAPEQRNVQNEQSLRPDDAQLEAEAAQTEHNTSQEQVGTDGTVSYDGVTFSLTQPEVGRWGLVRTMADGTTETLTELEGTPTALVRWGNTILVPENRDGGWDVVCYVVYGHGSASYVVDASGAKVQGTGNIASVELDGAVLRVTNEAGQTVDVALG